MYPVSIYQNLRVDLLGLGVPGHEVDKSQGKPCKEKKNENNNILGLVSHFVRNWNLDHSQQFSFGSLQIHV